MSRMRKLFVAALAGLAIAGASPASAQWGGYGDMGHGFGYSGYGQGNCGFGDCGGNDASALAGAVAGMATEVVGAGVANQSQNSVAPQNTTRSRKGGACYRQEWDSSEGWVNVAVPCQ